jgi:hypothetical protein
METQMEKPEKLKEYKERERFWTDKSITQLSFSIQITSALTVAVLGYLLNNHSCYEFHLNCPDFFYYFIKNLFYLLSLGFVLYSIFIGFLSMLSRNQDLKGTRHICYIRRKYYDEHNEYLGKENVDATNNICLSNFFKEKYLCELNHFTLSEFSRAKLLNEAEKTEFKNKFDDLRQKVHDLGKFTWKFHKQQIWTLFAALVFYTISVTL